MKIKIKMPTKTTLINFLKEYYPLLIIVLIATIIRIYHLNIRGDFWFDEWFSMHFATLPTLKESWYYWVLETNPPLHTFLLRCYLFFVNTTNETLIRLPSLILGISSIILLYFTAKKIFNKNTAIWSAILLSFSGLFIDLNTENRVYSLLMFLSIASLYLFYTLAFERKNKKIFWILYFITNLLLVYSHLTAIVILLLQMISLTLARADKKLVKKFFIFNFFVGIIWLFWFLPHMINILNLNTASAWYFTTSENFIKSILFSIIGAFTLINYPQVTPVIILLILLASIFFIKEIYKANNAERNKLVFLNFYFLFPIASSAMLGVMVTKYYSAFYPALFILFARLIDLYAKNFKRKFAVYTILPLIFLPLSYWAIVTPYFSWTEFTNHIKDSKTERSIIIIPHHETKVFKKYYDGDLPIAKLYLRDDNYSFEERVVKYNFVMETTTKTKLTKWLDDYTKNKNQVFLLAYENNYKWVDKILLEKGWELIYNKNGTGRTPYNLKEFIKNEID